MPRRQPRARVAPRPARRRRAGMRRENRRDHRRDRVAEIARVSITSANSPTETAEARVFAPPARSRPRDRISRRRLRSRRGRGVRGARGGEVGRERRERGGAAFASAPAFTSSLVSMFLILRMYPYLLRRLYPYVYFFTCIHG